MVGLRFFGLWFVVAVSFSFGVVNAQEQVCDAAKNADDWIVAGKESWLFSRTDLLPPVDVSPSLPYLKRLNEALAEQGVTLLMVINPKRPMVADTYLEPTESNQASYDATATRAAYEKTLADVRSVGIVAPDLLEVALNMPEGETYFFSGDHHWRPTGARAAARAVAQSVAELGLELTQTSFVTTENGTDDVQGGFASKVEEVCGVSWPDDMMSVFVTASSAEQSLLGDAPAAEVVMVGTSFSKSAREPGYNFEGFLKEALSTDVLNMAVTAGGGFGALQSYLLSETFRTQKPKLIVWELQAPTSRVFNNLVDYRQLIPAAKGGCTPETTVQSVTASIEGQSATLLTTTDSAVQGQGYFLSLRIADPTLVKFTVTLKHQDGQEDTVDIERSTRAENTGEYLIELSDIAAPLSEVLIGAEQAVTTSIDVSICQQ
jgi:alginate biosynthesis protein AlgX